MINKSNKIGFSDKTKNIVDELNLQFAKEGRCMTNPEMLFMMSYDSYDIKK